MDTPQTPRILAPHLQQFQYRIVRVLGKVTALRGETAQIDAGGNIDLVLNRVCFEFLLFVGCWDWGSEVAFCQQSWVWTVRKIWQGKKEYAFDITLGNRRLY